MEQNHASFETLAKSLNVSPSDQYYLFNRFRKSKTMSKNLLTKLSALAGLTLLAVSASALAAETAPVLDSKSCDPPKYPKAALINEETGTVVMGFLVGPDGKVTESKVEKTSGSKSLDKAALTALALCKFKPGTKDGKPDAVWAKVDFVWKLE